MGGVPISELRPDHFDGHTETSSMDAEQRLTWLSEIARFVYQARGLPSSGSDEAGILGIEVAE
jgi:hypothetical protein